MAGINISQQLKLGQQLTMTPQLKQAIHILQLPRLELEQYLRQQMAENPVLEEQGYGPEEPLTHIEKTTEEIMRDQISQVNGERSNNPEDHEVDWEVMARQHEALTSQLSPGERDSPSLTKRSLQGSKEEVNYEQVVGATISLAEHLKGQLHFSNWEPQKQLIAEEIIGNLDDRGYLSEKLADLAQRLSVKESLIEEVLKEVQTCDPTGVGARNMMDCLEIQMREWGLSNPHLIPILTSDITALQRRDFKKIARKLAITPEQVKEALDLAARLEPVPARAFTTEPPPYIQVDAVAVKLSDGWQIVCPEDGLPHLGISSYYESLAKSKDPGTKKGDQRYLRDKIRNASWLLKALQQRQSTVLRVSEVIVRRQTEFLEKGAHFLKPMVLKDVAREIDIHESTVSRVTAGKYIQTPLGIFELRYFFSSALSAHGHDHDNGVIAGESVRQMIKQIIDHEEAHQPFSDQKVTDMMALKGVKVARRTVAKYREQLRIPPSSERKRFAS